MDILLSFIFLMIMMSFFCLHFILFYSLSLGGYFVVYFFIILFDRVRRGFESL